MALVWMDGFEHYGTTSANAERGAYVDVGTITTTNPRTGTHCVSGTSTIVDKWLPNSNQDTIGVGFALRSGGLGTVEFLAFRSTGNNDICHFRTLANGSVDFRVNSSVVEASAPGVLSIGVYHHIEAFVDFDTGSNGSYELRVDGVTILQGSNLTTSGNVAGAAGLRVRSPGGTSYLDDFFMWDNTGTANNTFLGARHVITMFPNANEPAFQEWTGSYTDIDEADPDDDTTYISTSTAGDQSDYGFTDIPAGYADVAGVQLTSVVRKDDAGTASFAQHIISSGASTSGGTNPVTDGYETHTAMFDTDPNTAGAWTVSTANAAQARLRRVS